MRNSNLENIIVKNTKSSIPYSPIGGTRSKEKIPYRQRFEHGNLIKNSYEQIINDKKMKNKSIINGIYLEFNGEPDYDIVTKSLEDATHDIKLMNIQNKKSKDNKDYTTATLFVPNGAEKIFLNKVEQYLDSEKDTKSGNPKNMNLIICNISLKYPIYNYSLIFYC